MNDKIRLYPKILKLWFINTKSVVLKLLKSIVMNEI